MRKRVSVVFWKWFQYFWYVHIFLLLCKKLFIFIFYLISVTFRALTIFDQAFVKLLKGQKYTFIYLSIYIFLKPIFDQAFVKSMKYWQGEHMFLEGQKLCKEGNVVVRQRNIHLILIGLDSSVVEHLSSYSFIWYMYFIIYSSISSYPYYSCVQFWAA